MSRRAALSPEALRDLEQAADQLAEAGRDLGRRFNRAVRLSMEQLAAMPGLGAIWDQAPRFPGLRCSSVPGFRNYLIFYTTTDTRIEVLRILHGARDLPTLLDDDAGANAPAPDPKAD